VRLVVNGVEHRPSLDTRVTLLDTLREHLALTGTEERLRPETSTVVVELRTWTGSWSRWCGTE
jgi:aerobic-type carbon monoxide dehydrogenase small subunit (CoxS/CutS family)